jgi:hypothetical protein
VLADVTSITITTIFESSFRIAHSDLAGLWIQGGSAVYVSDLKPTRFEVKPFLGQSWDMQLDRSVADGDLRLGGGTYDKGLGLHSACTVAYAIPERAKRFEALAGLDELTGQRGDVTLQFRIDGRDAIQPPLELAGGASPKTVRIVVPKGAKQLIIDVGFGRGGDVQDHVDLVNARFILE